MTEPMTLDVARFYKERFVTGLVTNRTFSEIFGQQIYDGLPFEISGRVWLFGRKEARWTGKSEAHYPDVTGLKVGRTFDELHLLHGSRWMDVQGYTIAYVRLNYADGTKIELPICYGVHVLDWQRMGSEEKETLTDPNSKIVWRGQPASQVLKSTVRMTKTMIQNPLPQKAVLTLDFISTRHLASYDLVAATVANHDSSRPTTPALPATEPERHFDGAVTIRVIDKTTRLPIQGALVDPGMNVGGASVISPPSFTDSNGTTTIRYPLDHVSDIFISVERDGYAIKNLLWQEENFPDAVTVRMVPENK